MTQLKQIIKDIFIHLEEQEWHKPQPGPLAKSIVIESAELLEHFQWSEHNTDQIKGNPEKLYKIGFELADVMIYCLHLSEALGLDPEEINRTKLKTVEEKYPADKVIGNDAQYWKLKMEVRSK